MKKITVIAVLFIFVIGSVYADVRSVNINTDGIKQAKNLQVANPELLAIEKRLTALEEENKNLKAQLADLQNKQSGITTILNAAIVKLTNDFKGHTHSMGTRIEVTGGSAFQAPGYGAKQFFLTGKVHDDNIKTGTAIIN